MKIRVENSFAVAAPVEEAWKLLLDIPRVVPCMPGAELVDTPDEQRFRAVVRLRVGPAELQFGGEGELYDLDAAARTAKLRTKGSDTKGRGAFQTQMAFALAAQGRETLVRVDTELSLSGSVAQYGRSAGVVKEVLGQLTAQFARNLAALAAAENAEEAAGPSAPQESPRLRPGAAPISGFALALATLKAMLCRWLGARF